jgi:hypothetical protein
MNNGPRQQHQNFNLQDQYSSSSSSSYSQSLTITDHDSGVTKRCRGDNHQHFYQQSPSEQQSQHQAGYRQSNEAIDYSTPAVAHEAPLPESSSKRSRPNNYEAPRTVRPSILTATGSLVGGTTGHAFGLTTSANGPHSTVVHHRRQLSGGAIEQFIGGHDNMDADTNDHSRPRSMSF